MRESSKRIESRKFISDSNYHSSSSSLFFINHRRSFQYIREIHGTSETSRNRDCHVSEYAISRVKFCERTFGRSRGAIFVARRQCVVTINAGARRNEMWRHDMASAGERAARRRYRRWAHSLVDPIGRRGNPRPCAVCAHRREPARIPPTLPSRRYPFRAAPWVPIFLPLSLLSTLSALRFSPIFRFLFPSTHAARAACRADNTHTNAPTRSQTHPHAHIAHKFSGGDLFIPISVQRWVSSQQISPQCYSFSLSLSLFRCAKIVGAYSLHAHSHALYRYV